MRDTGKGKGRRRRPSRRSTPAIDEPIGADDTLDEVDRANMRMLFDPDEVLSTTERARRLGISDRALHARQRKAAFTAAMNAYVPRMIGRLFGQAARRYEKIIKGDHIPQARMACRDVFTAAIALDRIKAGRQQGNGADGADDQSVEGQVGLLNTLTATARATSGGSVDESPDGESIESIADRLMELGETLGANLDDEKGAAD